MTDIPLSRFGSTGVFVKEIERRLLDREIDLAVHSLKDVPAEETPALWLAAFPERADPRDVIIARDDRRFTALPAGARIGTSSARRRAQLRAWRPDLDFRDDLRGNVDTRIRKLRDSAYEAIVLAAAGLHRLGRTGEISEYLPVDRCLPDVGQGILAVQCRAADAEVLALLEDLDDPAVRAMALAERAVLVAAQGGCKVPLAAHAQLDGASLRLTALVATLDGSQIIRASQTGPRDRPIALGESLWTELARRGGRALLDEARGG